MISWVPAICSALCRCLHDISDGMGIQFSVCDESDQHGNANAFFGLLYLYLLIAALLRPLLWQMGGHSQPGLLFFADFCNPQLFMRLTGICVTVILLSRYLIGRR
jgi:hypothetical protein